MTDSIRDLLHAGDEANIPDPTANLRDYLLQSARPAYQAMVELRAKYVTSERDADIHRQIERLIENAVAPRNPAKPQGYGNRRPGVGFAVIGESGAGKSLALERAFAAHPAFPGFGTTHSGCPLISVGAPSPSTLGQLAMTILDALGYHTDRTLPENKAWRRARFQLEANRIMFLHIDDCQHVCHTLAEHERQRLSDTLKNLMLDRKWPVQLILSGIPDLVPFIERDRQLRRRLKYSELGNISAQQDATLVEGIIAEYCRKAGLTLEAAEEDMLVGRLVHGACNMLGLTIEILLDAIECALSAGKKTLSLHDFADAYTDRTLEREDLNVFTVHAWENINTSDIRTKFDLTPEASPQGPARGRRRPK